MGKRYFTKDKFEENGIIFFYLGTRKTKAGAMKLVFKEKLKAKKSGNVKLSFRLKKKGKNYRTYAGRKSPW